MSEVTSLRSYLVGLGFSVNTSEFNKFKGMLGAADGITDFTVGKIAKTVIKWQAAITGMFGAVAAAIVTTLDKVATADQDYRLFGERMFMDTKHARAMQIAVDALGHSLDEIAFDPELYQRFQLLQKDEALMGAGLGGDFETTMKQIRDIQFEFTRLKVELQFFTMGFVKNLFQQLTGGSDDLQTSLKKINDYIIKNLPEWSKEFATDVVPILKDTWEIAKGLGGVIGNLLVDFTNLVAVFSGDDSIRTQTFDFHKFAQAIDKVLHLITDLIKGLEWIESHRVLLGAITGAVGGAGVGALAGGVGALPGAVIGGLAGAGIGFGLDRAAKGANDGSTSVSAMSADLKIGESTGVDGARQVAKKVSAQTGIPAELIFAQMEHETGNFKNRGATELNNFAGINVPGGHGKDYRKFDSIDDFANYYAKLLSSKRYASQGLLSAKTPEEYAAALKRGGYMEDSAANYAHGMRGGVAEYNQGSGGSGDTYNDVKVTVVNPSGTTDVTKGVLDAMNRKDATQTQRNLAQFTPAYQ